MVSWGLGWASLPGGFPPCGRLRGARGPAPLARSPARPPSSRRMYREAPGDPHRGEWGVSESDLEVLSIIAFSLRITLVCFILLYFALFAFINLIGYLIGLLA